MLDRGFTNDNIAARQREFEPLPHRRNEADPKGQLLIFYEGREVQEDNNGKLNPSHSCGAGPPVHKATGGHGFSNITLRTISIISK